MELLALWRLFIAGLPAAALTAGGMLIYYEGLPIGPLQSVPLLGPALETLTDGRVDRERKAALAGYVSQAQLDAAKAQLAEAERQRNAGAIAMEEYRKKLLAAETASAVDEARHEQEISDYEKKLAAAGRSCLLDHNDLDWLLKP